MTILTTIQRNVGTLLLSLPLMTLSLHATAQPKLGPAAPATQIPALQSEEALARGAEATQQYAVKYGPVELSVVVVGVDDNQVVQAERSAFVDAIAAEVESQLADYTDGFMIIHDQIMDQDRAARLIQRQNKNDDPSESFIHEVAELASTPYVLAINVEEFSETSNAKKAAGVVTLRLIEVATARALVTISDQFWQDSQRYPDVPRATWVQHSVTYWMEELMGKRGYPRALAGPHLATIKFVGDVPVGLNPKIKAMLAEACGVPETAVNLRRSTEGFDVVTTRLLLQDPPHVVMDGLVQTLSRGFEKEGLTAEPLRQAGGDLIVSVARTPAWWRLTTPDPSSAARASWADLLEANDQPPVAVVGYNAASIAEAVEAQLIDAGANVVGVEAANQGFAHDRGASLSAGIKQRARWVCYVEAVKDPDGKNRSIARLVDLEADRVLGSAVFPATDAKVPAGEAKPDEVSLAARYLVGSVMADAVTHPQAYRTVDVAVEKCPSYEFGNRIGNIVLAQAGVADVILPSYDPANAYNLEVRYSGSPAQLSERLTADLSTLPLKVGSYAEGKITLVYSN